MTEKGAVIFLVAFLIYAVAGLLYARSLRRLSNALQVAPRVPAFIGRNAGAPFSPTNPSAVSGMLKYVWRMEYRDCGSSDAVSLGDKARFWLITCTVLAIVVLGGFMAMLFVFPA